MIGPCCTNTAYCCCEKHLKRGETKWHKHITDNLAHHPDIAFLFLHVWTHWAECMCFNMDALRLELYWFFRVTHAVISWPWGWAGRAWGQSSFHVTEANTLHDMYMNPPLDDKCAAQEQKLKWMVANLKWFRAVLSCMFVLCVIIHWFRFAPSAPVCYLLLLHYTLTC